MAENTVGIIGSGIVAQTLGAGFASKGWKVMLGTRSEGKLADWKKATGANALVGSMDQAAKFGRILVLAVKGTAAEAAVKTVGAANLAGKTVLDACNPIADEPPQDGVLRYFLGPNESLMERLQALAPAAKFVKAFSSVGAPEMVDPQLPGGKPTMFICGSDEAAKKEAAQVIEAFGWEVADMGTAAAARAIEPLAMLWCIPGLREGRWAHAFKLLKA